jgi:hypothetical protein
MDCEVHWDAKRGWMLLQSGEFSEGTQVPGRVKSGGKDRLVIFHWLPATVPHSL